MKRTLSLILATALVLACVLSLASCGSFTGEYTDSLGQTWNFKGSKLEVETSIEVDKASHTVVLVYDYETRMDGETEKLVLTYKKCKYSGDNATVKEKIKESNTYYDLLTETGKTSEYTVTRDANGAYINITKSGVTTKLTLK